MKQGFDMYLRAVSHLFANLWAAVWATAPAWVALTILTSLAAYLIVGEVADPQTAEQSPEAFVLPPYFWTYFMVAQCLNFMTLGFVGPKFHRSTLQENTSDLPLPYASYLFGLMQLGMIGIGLALLGSRIVEVISGTLPGPLGEITLPIILLFGVCYVLLRFCLILPALSMGRPKTLKQAWLATSSFRYSFITSLILLLATIAGLHSVPLFLENSPWLGLVIGTITSWFALTVLLSYLNVIYRETRRQEVRMAQKT